MASGGPLLPKRRMAISRVVGRSPMANTSSPSSALMNVLFPVLYSPAMTSRKSSSISSTSFARRSTSSRDPSTCWSASRACSTRRRSSATSSACWRERTCSMLEITGVGSRLQLGDALKSKSGPGYDCGMDRRRLWHRVRRVWIILGLSATAVFVIWSLIAYRASAEAHAATRADSVVDVRHDAGIWSFVPRSAASTRRTGLVFFPGALVDPVAYAPIARATAAEGFPSFIVELPRRGAFGGADSPEMWSRLRRLLHQPGMPPRWVAAGHSRGGVVASRLASDPPDGFAGLV